MWGNYNVYPYFKTMNDIDKFIWLMANVDSKIINLVSEYIHVCFQVRNTITNNLNS